jgi:3,4-dihydroxy 2-butanone 4-phosphate synthase / GTP cyclohydrolase II
MRLAGLQPAAAICEVMRDDSEMARRPDLELFAAQHDLPILSTSDLVAYRCKTEVLVEQVASADFPSAFSGDAMRVHAIRSLLVGTEHLATVKAPMTRAPLARVHSECLTGAALCSLRCDCGAQLQESLRMIGESGGVLIYLRGQEVCGIGLANKIRAYALQDKGRDTVEANTEVGFAAHARDYAIAAQTLRALGVVTITLLTNNPQKAETLRANGIDVQEQQSLNIAPNPLNFRYLETKCERLGHTLTHQN